ncbi:MAG: hypothetical protein EZS28_018641 [Streblomastix strix]|uniref:Uncharacterized protein n=1 Tax=Streblomastix strix TaxID=222440 RepID=A0A5J4VT78_9EUKA|nr:MAG: hypothetical protein EZS28_018641 [Streblomastix strix]
MSKQESMIFIKLISHDERYAHFQSIGETVGVPGTVTTAELKSLLVKQMDITDATKRNFLFILGDRAIDTGKTLKQSIDELEFISEQVIEIEFIEPEVTPPKRKRSLAHDDAVLATTSLGGKWAMTGCLDGTTHVWNLTGEHISQMRTHEFPITCISAFYIDGEGENIVHIITGSKDAQLSIWEVRIEDKESVIWRKQAELNAHSDSVQSCAVSYDCRLLISGGWDGCIFNAPYSIMSISGYFKPPSSQQTMPFARIITGHVDGCIRLWDPHSPIRISSRPYRHCNSGFVSVVAWCQDSDFQFISLGHDGRICVWDMRSPTALHRKRVPFEPTKPALQAFSLNVQKSRTPQSIKSANTLQVAMPSVSLNIDGDEYISGVEQRRNKVFSGFLVNNLKSGYTIGCGCDDVIEFCYFAVGMTSPKTHPRRYFQCALILKFLKKEQLFARSPEPNQIRYQPAALVVANANQGTSAWDQAKIYQPLARDLGIVQDEATQIICDLKQNKKNPFRNVKFKNQKKTEELEFNEKSEIKLQKMKSDVQLPPEKLAFRSCTTPIFISGQTANTPNQYGVRSILSQFDANDI